MSKYVLFFSGVLAKNIQHHYCELVVFILTLSTLLGLRIPLTCDLHSTACMFQSRVIAFNLKKHLSEHEML